MIFFMVGAVLNFVTPSFLTFKYLPIIVLIIYFCDSHLIGKVIYPLAVAAFVYILVFKTSVINIHDGVGDLSYGIYIFHYPVIQFLYQWGLYNNFFVGFVLTVAVVGVLSYCSWHFMEKRLTSHGQVKSSPLTSVSKV